MKKYTLPLIAALFMLAGTQTAQAQARFEIGPRAGYDIDELNEFFLGADARISLAALPVQLNPTFDYYFVEGDVSLFQLIANALYNFGFNNQVFTPYAGAGVGFTRTSVDTGLGSASNTETGLNLIGGATFGFGSLKPFAQAQITFNGGDSSDLVTLGGGVLFSLGQ